MIHYKNRGQCHSWGFFSSGSGWRWFSFLHVPFSKDEVLITVSGTGRISRELCKSKLVWRVSWSPRLQHHVWAANAMSWTAQIFPGSALNPTADRMCPWNLTSLTLNLSLFKLNLSLASLHWCIRANNCSYRGPVWPAHQSHNIQYLTDICYGFCPT